jgi:hypothetical protein
MVAPSRQELQDGDGLRVGNTVFAVLLSDRPLEHVVPGEGQHEGFVGGAGL